MLDQARGIASLAVTEEAVAAFSADLGPDLLVPWRHPTLTVVYSNSDLALGGAGLVPTEGRSDASIVVRWTSDATLLSPAVGRMIGVDTRVLRADDLDDRDGQCSRAVT